MKSLFAGVLAMVILVVGGCATSKSKKAADLADMANEAMGEEDYLQAQRLYEEASLREPLTWQYHVGVGNAAIKAGNPGIAESHYSAALKLLNESTAAEMRDVRNEASVLYMLGREKEALALLEDASRRFPDNAELRQSVEEWDATAESLNEYRVERQYP